MMYVVEPAVKSSSNILPPLNNEILENMKQQKVIVSFYNNGTDYRGIVKDYCSFLKFNNGDSYVNILNNNNHVFFIPISKDTVYYIHKRDVIKLLDTNNSENELNLPKISKEKWNNLLNLAEKGDSDAQNQIGNRYRIGDDSLGIKKDYAMAIKWYHKSAIQNNFAAQYRLGIMYRKGEGVEKNLDISEYWFAKNRKKFR